jgi:hypothetical protein
VTSGRIQKLVGPIFFMGLVILGRAACWIQPVPCDLGEPIKMRSTASSLVLVLVVVVARDKWLPRPRICNQILPLFSLIFSSVHIPGKQKGMLT